MNKPSICSQTRDRHLGRSCSGQYGPWFQAILKIKKCCVLCCYVVTLLHCYDGWKCRACHCWHVSPHVGISQHLCIIIIIPCKAMNIPLFLYIYLIIYIYIWCENQGRFDPYPYWFFAPGPHPVKRRFSIRATWCNQSHLENPRSKWDLVKRPQSILGTMKWQDQQAIKQQTTRTNMILWIYIYMNILLWY
jgi:hypothetical protein